MYWLNMSLQIPILGSLIITLIARISNFFMYRLNMNLQISLCRSLMVTLITRIFDLTLLASVQAGEHLLGQGCPVLFITLSSLILAGKWGGSRVQWGGWSFFRAFGHSSPWAELELVTTLSPSLWCYLPTFPLRIFTFRVLLNNRETSTQLPWQLVSDTRGNRSHSHLLLSGRPSPSTASSSKVLRVVTSDFQNFHLTANKVCDWFVDVLIDDTVI